MHAAPKQATSPIIQMTLDEFIVQICRSEVDGDPRQRYAESFRNVHDWARQAGAKAILVGGSFIDQGVPNPKDIDLIVLFKDSATLQRCPETILVKETRFDFQYVAEDQEELTNSFLYLLGVNKAGVKANLIHIKLHHGLPDLHVPSIAPALYSEVLAAYQNRDQINFKPTKGLIVPIHGINTNAAWLHYFSLVATERGWGFAPFVYGREWVTTLVNPARQRALVTEFRHWLNEVRQVHKGPICIFAHSLGSYVFVRFLMSMGDLDQRFCGVIFAGSIVTCEFDWSPFIDQGRVTSVFNTFSRNDGWVRMMPRFGKYGRAGAEGFHKKHVRLSQIEVPLLGHTDMFERDLICGHWMPFFEAAFELYEGGPCA